MKYRASSGMPAVYNKVHHNAEMFKSFRDDAGVCPNKGMPGSTRYSGNGRSLR
ncbi:MAG: hypothetical protein AWU59_2133 [Methanolobus sp. T82-4]|jgi:hypothetical protein|nr:MAG: hypothetical protein AWU59_2133 [Methanolobus sp. T82-4]